MTVVVLARLWKIMKAVVHSKENMKENAVLEIVLCVFSWCPKTI